MGMHESPDDQCCFVCDQFMPEQALEYDEWLDDYLCSDCFPLVEQGRQQRWSRDDGARFT